MMTAGPRPGRRIEITGWLGRRLSALTSFGEDGRGELLAAAGSSVYRFVRPARSPRVQTSLSVSRGAGAGGLVAVPEPSMLVMRFAGLGSNRR
jgi:hypothetical protein